MGTTVGVTVRATEGSAAEAAVGNTVDTTVRAAKGSAAVVVGRYSGNAGGLGRVSRKDCWFSNRNHTIGT